MKKQTVFTIILFLLVSITAFFFGTRWTTILYGISSIPRDKLTCFSQSNFWEDYQTNCFLPDRINTFTFREKLKCTAYTNQQFSESLYSLKEGNRTTAMMIKSESIRFSLTFQNDKIIRSRDTGSMDPLEDYTIIKDEHNIIQAVRPVNKENYNQVYSYEFLTFSKKSGRGMEVWQNITKNNERWTDDSIGSYFFQCE